jgi:hypothetical protein
MRLGSSARASVRRAPARAPSAAAALVAAWRTSPCVPSTVRTTGSSGANCWCSPSARRPGSATRWKAPESWAILQRPGGVPRARNSSASQAEDSRRSRVERVGDRRRACHPPAHPARRSDWRFRRGAPASTALGHALDATASRRVAVKSSAAGSPYSSPMTAERAEHLTPSSIAHRAERASRAST